MSFYNSKRRSLILIGRNSSPAAVCSEDYTNCDSCGSTSSSSSSTGGGGGITRTTIMAQQQQQQSTSPTTSSTSKNTPTYSLQQLARSRSFGGVYQPPYCSPSYSPFSGNGGGGSSSSRRHKSPFYYNNYSSQSFILHGSNNRTGTWSSQHSPGLGVLGQGYGSPSGGSGGGMSRKLMNSLGTLTHSNNTSNNSTNVFGSNYYGTGSSTNIGTGGGGLLGSNSQSMRILPTSGLVATSGNVVKTPRPNKTRIAIESLIHGLQDCIKQVEDEMSQIRSSIQDLSSIGENQYSKSSVRHLKRIEYQLSIVEELGEQYSLQQKLREGVRTMAFAYSVSQGPEKETALANVKAGFRECTEMLCNLETQLEMLLGTFHMEMKGIQGFARLCPGDVFEITIKHGQQKWKTRGKVGKDGSQVWDLPLATFRAVLGEVMHIKAAEVKTLGKHILLGNKFCEISELFSSHAQLMTVNLNPTGSLKLNIIVTWNPLDSMMMDDYRVSPNGSLRSHSQHLIGSPSRKRRLSPTEINFRHSMSSISPDNTVSCSGSTVKNTKTTTAEDIIVDEVDSTQTNVPNASSSTTVIADEDNQVEPMVQTDDLNQSSSNNKNDHSQSQKQNPSSRSSALWERSLDTIEIIEASNSKKNTEKSSSLKTNTTQVVVENNNSTNDSNKSESFRFCSLTTPSKTSRRTSSPEVTIINKNKHILETSSKSNQIIVQSEPSSSTSTTIHIESQNSPSPTNPDDINIIMNPSSSPSKIMISSAEDDEDSLYKHDPNIHRISIGSSTSSLNSDPSGNFTFVKKRSGSIPNNERRTSQIEFETNIALEELDMAIIDGDNSTNHITTIEESMEEFYSHHGHGHGDDDEGSFDDNGFNNSKKINSSNIGLFTLRNSVLRLSSLLEDIQGQYHELEPLEMHLTTLEKMIQNPCFISSSSSSLNIESALECFDFLDSEDSQIQSPVNNNNSISICELPSNNHNIVEDSVVGNNASSQGVYIFGTSSRYHQHRHQSNDIMDPKMTARTTDSGISSLGHHSRSPSPTTSRNSSPMHTVTGSSQLDMALGAHIQMCLQLIHNVGSFGPLKHREKEAISKLQQQGIIIGSIIGRSKSHDASITNGLLELASLPQLQVLWERITDTGASLCTSADNAIHGLESDIKAIIQCKYSSENSQIPNLPRKVSHLLVQQILDTGNANETFDLGQILTVFQFQNFLRPHEHSFHKLIDDLTEEEILQSSLQQSNLVSGIRSLPLSVPPKNVLFAIIRLLLHEDPEVRTLVKNYFNAISIAADKKRQIIETSIEMLEFSSAKDRQAACLIFIELKNFWRIKSYVIEPLLYLIQTDRSEQVRSTAKETILSIMGDDEGDRILQQVALSTHGFQGLGVN